MCPEPEYRNPFTVGDAEQRLPSAYVPAGGNVIWQWDEHSVAQFDTALRVKSISGSQLSISNFTISASGLTGGVGPRLRMTWTMTDLSGGCMILPIFSQTGSYLAVPNRFRILYRIAEAQNMKVGFCVWNGNLINPKGFAIAQLAEVPAAEVNWFDSSVVGGEAPWYSVGNTPIYCRQPGNTTGNPSVGAYYEDVVYIDNSTASTTILPFWGHTSPFGQASGATSQNFAIPTDLIGNPPNAVWTGASGFQYLALCFMTNRTTGTYAEVELADMQVLSAYMGGGY